MGVLLPRGTSKEEVPRRLEFYEKARKERAEFMQMHSLERLVAHETRFNAGQFVCLLIELAARCLETVIDEILRVRAAIMEHDALKHAQEILDEGMKLI